MGKNVVSNVQKREQFGENKHVDTRVGMNPILIMKIALFPSV